MTDIKIPDNFMGVPIDGAMQKVLEKQKNQSQSKASEPARMAVNANINPDEYVIIPQENKVIAYNQGFNNLDYNGTHLELAKNGLFMPTPRTFTAHLTNVIKAHEGGTVLYYASGKLMYAKEANDLYRKLMRNCWSWLNARFSEIILGKGFKYIELETITGVNKRELITKREPLEQCLAEKRYANMEFNKHGLAVSASISQNYQQGKNIYFYPPKADCVARFNARLGGVYLCCDGSPDLLYSSLGTFACADAQGAKTK